MSGIVSKIIGNAVVEEVKERLDDKTHVYAKEKLKIYKANGVFQGNYEDEIWTITNGQKYIYLDFKRIKKDIESVCAQNKVSVQMFIEHLKDFMILILGKYELNKVRNDLYSIIRYTINSNMGNKKDSSFDMKSIRIYVDFISMVEYYPQEYIEFCKQVLRGIKAHEKASRRVSGKIAQPIPEFQSFFKFMDLVLEIPTLMHKKEELLYMYPLYLYWKITTIIPCRVTEFCITPLNCIRNNKNHYYLRLRKTKKKGNRGELGSITSYIIEKDYSLHEYEITKAVYDEIQWFIDSTRTFRQLSTSKKLLFSAELYEQFRFHEGGQKINTELAFTDEMLNKVMTDFYQLEVSKHFKIIERKSLLKKIDKTGISEIADDEIVRLNNNQTRHLSIMNLILRGANPVIAKEFAGHASIDMTENYYQHINDFVRVGTHYYYHLQKETKEDKMHNQITNPLIIYGANYQTKLKNGTCFSEQFANGCARDCEKCNGICQNCDYFEEDTSSDEELKTDFLAFKELLYDSDLESNIEEFNRTTLRLQHEIRNVADSYIRDLLEREV